MIRSFGPEGRRYARQICLPQIGPLGQKRLAGACVLIVGVGGLGSVSALYMAAAGIGHIKLVDDDCVEYSNLNRQIVHSEAFLGQPKAISAAARIKALNTTIQVTPVQDRLAPDNVRSLLGGVDLIVDGSDNYETRRLMNRASVQYGLPFIYAGVDGFDAMVSCFNPPHTACFECVFKGGSDQEKTEPPGVVGPAAGMAASLQSMEALKLLLGIGRPILNQIIRISGLDMRIQSVSLTADPGCPVCRIQH